MLEGSLIGFYEVAKGVCVNRCCIRMTYLQMSPPEALEPGVSVEVLGTDKLPKTVTARDATSQGV